VSSLPSVPCSTPSSTQQRCVLAAPWQGVSWGVCQHIIAASCLVTHGLATGGLQWQLPVTVTAGRQSVATTGTGQAELLQPLDYSCCQTCPSRLPSDLSL
jgi:hypothetical protein